MNNISIGGSYQKYLSGASYQHVKIECNDPAIKEKYIITNKPNAPLYKGVLEVYSDGRAMINAKYTTYSGVMNNYKVYFDKEGNEIIHNDNSSREEKKYFDLL